MADCHMCRAGQQGTSRARPSLVSLLLFIAERPVSAAGEPAMKRGIIVHHRKSIGLGCVLQGG